MKPGDWRRTNPGFEYSPPKRITINGKRCVELDGGKLYEMAQVGKKAEAPTTKGAK